MSDKLTDGSKMKKIIYAIIMSLPLLLASCNKENQPLSTDSLKGTWNLEQIDGIPAGELSVWMEFSDKTFDIYQRLGNKVSYEHYSGTWSLVKGVLSGSYSDGKPWASSYNATITDGVQLKLEAVGNGEVSTYRKSNIPSEVRETIISEK